MSTYSSAHSEGHAIDLPTLGPDIGDSRGRLPLGVHRRVERPVYQQVGNVSLADVIIGSEANGIQLGSKCALYQGLAQQTSWFAHKREGFGPPLFDSGLDAVQTYGIDEQELQRVRVAGRLM